MNTISDLTPLIPEIIAENVSKALASIYIDQKEAEKLLCEKAEKFFKTIKLSAED